jgi:hypothetical protein
VTTQASLFRDGDFVRLWTIGLVGFFVRWMEILVFGIFTYQLTGSAFMVASMTMLRLLPLAVLGVPLGALAARVPRRNALALVQCGLSVLSLALLALAALGLLQVWHIAVASVLNGIAWAGDNPFRRGLIGDVAGPQRMGHAMALDVGASNASRLVGLLLAQSGMTAVFLLVAVLYLVALVAVLRVRDRPLPQEASPSGLRTLLAEGFLAARASPRLAGTLWITVLFNLFGWPVLSMVPVIGKDRLGLAPDGIGLLASMEGVGTLIGAVALVTLARPAIYGPALDPRRRRTAGAGRRSVGVFCDAGDDRVHRRARRPAHAGDGRAHDVHRHRADRLSRAGLARRAAGRDARRRDLRGQRDPGAGRQLALVARLLAQRRHAAGLTGRVAAGRRWGAGARRGRRAAGACATGRTRSAACRRAARSPAARRAPPPAAR